MNKFAYATLLCCVALATTTPRLNATASDQAGLIDLRPALTIRSTQVSHYLVDKYYKRFVAGVERDRGRFPSEEEARSWLELFIAQQLVIEHATSQGYLNRAEVNLMVARMEQHMLTQPYGPLYQQLYGDLSPTGNELGELYQKSHIFREGVIERFDCESDATKALGADFAQCTIDVKIQRILNSRNCGTGDGREGPFRWPYRPFPEIGAVIESAIPGTVAIHHEPSFGYYYICISNVHQEPADNFVAEQKAFAVYVRQTREDVIFRRRRNEVLRAASIIMNSSNAERILKYWSDIPFDRDLPELPESLAAETLFQYRLGQDSIKVTVDAYRRNNNQLLVRKIPHNLTALREGAEDMVMAIMDVKEAKIRRLNLTPQFLEDRKGFTGFQVLDLFEKEVLRPRLAINREQIETYYRDNKAEFVRRTRVDGKLLVFSSMQSASAWLSGERRIPALPALPPVPDEEKEVVVSRDTPLPGLENFTESFMRCEPGNRCGPIPLGRTTIIFIRGNKQSEELVPFEQVREEIQHKFEHIELDQMIRQMGRTLAHQIPFTENLDHAQYGVRPGPILAGP